MRIKKKFHCGKGRLQLNSESTYPHLKHENRATVHAASIYIFRLLQSNAVWLVPLLATSLLAQCVFLRPGVSIRGPSSLYSNYFSFLFFYSYQAVFFLFDYRNRGWLAQTLNLQFTPLLGYDIKTALIVFLIRNLTGFLHNKLLSANTAQLYLQTFTLCVYVLGSGPNTSLKEKRIYMLVQFYPNIPSPFLLILFEIEASHAS